jgi:hypothetical protein
VIGKLGCVDEEQSMLCFNPDRRYMIGSGAGMHILHCDITMLAWMML